MAIMMNDVGHNAVTDFGCVSCRSLWVKLTISRVKMSGGGV